MVRLPNYCVVSTQAASLPKYTGFYSGTYTFTDDTLINDQQATGIIETIVGAALQSGVINCTCDFDQLGYSSTPPRFLTVRGPTALLAAFEKVAFAALANLSLPASFIQYGDVFETPRLPLPTRSSYLQSPAVEDPAAHSAYLQCILRSYNIFEEEMTIFSEPEGDRVLVTLNKQYSPVMSQYRRAYMAGTLPASCLYFGVAVARPADNISLYEFQEEGFDYAATEYLTNPTAIRALDVNGDGIEDLLVLQQGTPAYASQRLK